MYNRILKRPMFRRGGPSFQSQGTGITSPFDTPRRGLVQHPGGYAGKTIEELAIEKEGDKGAYAKISVDRTYFLGAYTAIDEEKLKALPKEEKEKVEKIAKRGKQSALANITVFPIMMLLAYIGLACYFKRQGGYKAVELDSK